MVAPYLPLSREDAGRMEHDLREVFNGFRHIVKTGALWRCIRRSAGWLAGGCFEALVDDLRAMVRVAARQG